MVAIVYSTNGYNNPPSQNKPTKNPAPSPPPPVILNGAKRSEESLNLPEAFRFFVALRMTTSVSTDC
jgi:hypothetical protein